MNVSPITAVPAAAAQPMAISYERYRTPLLGYVHNRTELIDWNRSEDIARKAFAQAVGSLQLSTEAGMEDEGLPAWLAFAARSVIREQTSPAFLAAQRLSATVAQPQAPAEPHSLSLIETPATGVSASQVNASPVPLAA